MRFFTSMLDGEKARVTVYINRDPCRAGYLVAGPEALPDRLVHVALEEAHFVTNGATENSREYQNFLLDLAVKLGRKSGRRLAAQA